MRETVRKWGKRLLWVLTALLAVYCLGKLADFVWFRTQIPVGFQNANWTGSWHTEQFSGISGRLLVRLPDPLPENQDFKAEALVYYPIYSGWKTGQFIKMDFTGHFSPDTPASAGKTNNSIPGGGGKLKFKGVVGNQVVAYVALIDPSRTRIVGGYLSRTPYDYGNFIIQYYYTTDSAEPRLAVCITHIFAKPEESCVSEYTASQFLAGFPGLSSCG